MDNEWHINKLPRCTAERTIMEPMGSMGVPMPSSQQCWLPFGHDGDHDPQFSEEKALQVMRVNGNRTLTGDDAWVIPQ